MTVRPILQVGDPRLRRVARPVPVEALGGPPIQQLIDDLIETMHAAHGAGIAAPQIGEGLRIFVVHVRDNPRYPYKPPVPLTVFVNPQLTILPEADGRYASAEIYEGCLSVPGLRGRVRRALRVRGAALDRHGAPFTFEAQGLTAGTLQHELAHLDGRLFLDELVDSRSLTTWENFDLFHKAAFLREAEAINARFPSGALTRSP